VDVCRKGRICQLTDYRWRKPVCGAWQERVARVAAIAKKDGAAETVVADQNVACTDRAVGDENGSGAGSSDGRLPEKLTVDNGNEFFESFTSASPKSDLLR
jgi:hypothetical protein